MNYQVQVGSVLAQLFSQNSLFTCYDVTRILQSKVKTPVDHNQVRSVVESSFFNGLFPKGWDRHVGNHLSFRPDNPQVYFNTKTSNWPQYDPNALDPNVKVKPLPGSRHSTGCVVYTLKHPTNDQWAGHAVKSGFGGRPTVYLLNEAVFYGTKNGPLQIKNKSDRFSKYVITPYEVKPVA